VAGNTVAGSNPVLSAMAQRIYQDVRYVVVTCRYNHSFVLYYLQNKVP